MVRDERKQNRGYGFIKFSHRHMALAAIRALHGAHTMRGCDRPLIVRFADPKKPRNAESRDTSSFGRSNLGPHPQELFVRSAPDFSDLSDRNVLPNIFHPQISTSSQAEAVPQSQNQQPAAPSVMQKPFHLLEKSPSELPQVPSKQLQFLQESSQSQAVPEMQTQLHLIQPSTESSEQQQDSQVTMKKQSPQIGSNSQAVFRDSTPSAVVASSTTAVASAVLEKALTVDPPDCDWSEHICPDGYKYYYNCVTCESRWEKPEEFVLFEQKLQKLQHLLKPPSQQLESLPHPPSHFIPQVSRTQEFVRGPATATPIIDPACVH
ncbi:flowering time control protein FCA-like [Malania oleifera]|uniref:flowering time control protein FCA-like n=1 Tax=Malania oleifera TaxID=397392 RepID=UPI0025AE1DA6|nr:flowering time control protein FCA-like [Malania oleifera]